MKPALLLTLPVLCAGISVPVIAAPASSAALQDGRGLPPPDRAARQERQEADLALVLALRPQQRAALHAFVAAEESSMPAGPPHLGAPRTRADTPPDFGEMLSRREEAEVARAQDDRARIVAIRNFYAQLDAQQQQVFDALWRLRLRPEGHPDPQGRDGPGAPDARGRPSGRGGPGIGGETPPRD